MPFAGMDGSVTRGGQKDYFDSEPRTEVTGMYGARSMASLPKRRRRSERIAMRLLAHDAIPVPVSHVPIRRVRTRDRRDAVPASFLAGDPPVSIVVVTRECIVTGGGTGSGFTG